MLFNDYPFLLVFLPAALLIYRLADPYPRLRIGVQVALSLAFYAWGSPSFILLLIGSIAINWLASVVYGRVKWPAVLTLVIVARSRGAGVVQIRQLPSRQSRSRARYGRCRRSTSRCRSASRSSPSITSCIWSICGAAKRRTTRSTATRSTSLLPAGDRRPAGALVGGDAPVRPAGLCARAGSAQFALGVSFIAIGLIEKILLGDRSAASSIRSMRRPGSARCRTAMPGSRSASRSRSCSISAGYSDIAIGLGLLFGVSCRTISMRRCARPASRISGSAGTSP